MAVSSEVRTPNEVLLLESRLDQKRKETHPNSKSDDYFLLSSIDTVLRSRRLSYQQIEDGIVEGGDDGGIDAVYIFYNGTLVEDDPELGGGNRPQIELELVQAKNERGFKELAMQRLIDHLPLLLQLDEDSRIRSEFNERVMERFSIFRAVFLRASNRFPELTIRVRYATKSVDEPNEKVHRKSERLVLRVHESFRDAKVEVDFVGAADLNARARRRLSETLDLRIAEGPVSAEKGGIVGLVSLADYYNFIRDDDRLRDELFEENVRGYEGVTGVNRAIGESLREGDDSSADFWWLNNGVTILGRRVQVSRKRLTIEDPQIVNGLQTSRNVFSYFHSVNAQGRESGEGESRHLLVRVIEASDEGLAAKIIKATNNQNRVSVASLRATEPLQKDIEEYLAKYDYYYERKKNFYKNQGKPRSRIVEVLELAQAVAAIVLCEPHTARAKPSALVRNPLYPKVFNKSTPLAAILNCIRIMQSVDSFLESSKSMARADRSNIRFQLARAATAFALSSFRPKPTVVAQMDVARLDEVLLDGALQWVVEARDAVQRASGVTDLNVMAKGAEWSREMDRRLFRYTDKTRWPKRLTPSP